MKLSMWMIVNRLYDFELELHIRDNTPSNLKSARRAYATDCVYVYQSGNDSVCRNGDDYIVIKDLLPQEAVEIVQAVFDYYNDWDSMIHNAAAKMNFQEIIDRSWHIFHNPIVLLDGNWNVLALSTRYGEDELDAEWKHLCRYGSSSLDVYTFMKNDPLTDYRKAGTHYYRMNNPMMSNCISSIILYDGVTCGRINVLEKDRELNRGDMQIVDHLIHTLSMPMGIQTMRKNQNFLSVYHNLLSGQKVNEETLLKQMQYMDWEDNVDSFHLFVASPSLPPEGMDPIFLFKNQLSRLMPQCVFEILDNNIVIIVNHKHLTQGIKETIRELNKNNDFLIGESLQLYNIRGCRTFYDQARFAIRCARNAGIDRCNDILSFYDCAIEFIIRFNHPDDLIMACHPDIIHLWKLDQESQSERLKTFRAYLDNERSLVKSAQQLYIHRNTFVYRINQILEILEYDLNDAYTQDYMKLSMRILDIFGEKIHEERSF